MDTINDHLTLVAALSSRRITPTTVLVKVLNANIASERWVYMGPCVKPALAAGLWLPVQLGKLDDLPAATQWERCAQCHHYLHAHTAHHPEVPASGRPATAGDGDARSFLY